MGDGVTRTFDFFLITFFFVGVGFGVGLAVGLAEGFVLAVALVVAVALAVGFAVALALAVALGVGLFDAASAGAELAIKARAIVRAGRASFSRDPT